VFPGGRWRGTVAFSAARYDAGSSALGCATVDGAGTGNGSSGIVVLDAAVAVGAHNITLYLRRSTTTTSPSPRVRGDGSNSSAVAFDPVWAAWLQVDSGVGHGPRRAYLPFANNVTWSDLSGEGLRFTIAVNVSQRVGETLASEVVSSLARSQGALSCGRSW